MKACVALEMSLLAGLAVLPAQAQDAAFVDVPVQGRESVSYAYADVLRATPQFEVMRRIEQREECREEAAPRRERGNGGALAGSIIGGLLGNRVGSGSGRRVATVAGAVAGGVAGNAIDSGVRTGDAGNLRRCRIVDVEHEDRRIVGYDVEYRFKGELYMSHMDYDPGNKLRVRVTVAPAD